MERKALGQKSGRIRARKPAVVVHAWVRLLRRRDPLQRRLGAALDVQRRVEAHGSEESVGQARLKPRAAPQWRFGAEAEVEVEYEGVDNWHAAFVESVVRVRGADRYNVVIDEGARHQVPGLVHGDRLRPRS